MNVAGGHKHVGNLWRDRRAFIERAFAEGKGTDFLAKQFGCSRATLRTAIYRMGIKVPACIKIDAERAKLKAMWADPKIRARLLASSTKGGSASWRKTLGFLPPHMKADYIRTVKSGVHAAVARQMYRDEWLKQLRRALNAIAEVARRNPPTPFQRQLERVRNGAKLVPAWKQTRAVSQDRSLIGCSSGML